jgi:ribose 1,5-bisphosphokinase PhnN
VAAAVELQEMVLLVQELLVAQVDLAVEAVDALQQAEFTALAAQEYFTFSTREQL